MDKCPIHPKPCTGFLTVAMEIKLGNARVTELARTQHKKFGHYDGFKQTASFSIG